MASRRKTWSAGYHTNAIEEFTCVEITDTGRKIAKTELGPSELASAALFDDLSTREQAELLRLLIKVADSLRARGIDIPQYRG